MKAPVKALVFAGSTRAGSWNRKLAAAAARVARADGAEVTELHLADLALPLYDGDLEAQAVPVAVVRLKELLYTHEAWIIATPRMPRETLRTTAMANSAKRDPWGPARRWAMPWATFPATSLLASITPAMKMARMKWRIPMPASRANPSTH